MNCAIYCEQCSCVHDSDTPCVGRVDSFECIMRPALTKERYLTLAASSSGYLSKCPNCGLLPIHDCQDHGVWCWCGLATLMQHQGSDKEIVLWNRLADRIHNLRKENESLRGLQYAVGHASVSDVPESVANAWKDSDQYRQDTLQVQYERIETLEGCLRKVRRWCRDNNHTDCDRFRENVIQVVDECLKDNTDD